METEVFNTAVEISDAASNIMVDMFGEAVNLSNSELFTRGLEVLREGHPFGEALYHVGAGGVGMLLGATVGLAAQSLANLALKIKHERGVITVGSKPEEIDMSPEKEVRLVCSLAILGSVIGTALSFK